MPLLYRMTLLYFEAALQAAPFKNILSCSLSGMHDTFVLRDTSVMYDNSVMPDTHVMYGTSELYGASKMQNIL